MESKGLRNVFMHIRHKITKGLSRTALKGKDFRTWWLFTEKEYLSAFIHAGIQTSGSV